MKKKYIAQVVFGEIAVNEYENANGNKWNKANRCGEGDCVTRIFNTQDECDAYVMGVTDCFCWHDYVIHYAGEKK